MLFGNDDMSISTIIICLFSSHMYGGIGCFRNFIVPKNYGFSKVSELKSGIFFSLSELE